MNKGRWIRDLDEEMPELRFGYKCSKCDKRQSMGPVPFCMYCGSQMDSSKTYGDAFKVWGEDDDTTL